MSTYTKRRRSPQGQHISEKRHGNVYTQGHIDFVPGRTTDGVDRPFPHKPVSHRRPLNPSTQDSLDLHDFEKLTITKQPRGVLAPQDTSQTTASQHPRKDSHRLPKGEMQMAKAIHAKELLLQEKLWRVEEKIRQKIQRDSVDTTVGDDRKDEEEKHSRGQAERRKAQTKTRLSEQQRREPVRGKEMNRQDQRNENRMRNLCGEEVSREIEVAQNPKLQRKGIKETQEVTVHGPEVSGELNKSRWENVKRQTRRKGEDETGVKSQDGMEKAKEREQNTTSTGDKGWTTEKTYKERPCEETYRAATENHKDAGRKLSVEPLLPPSSGPSHFSRPEQEGVAHSIDTGPQLLPCRICNRKFASKRLEKHVQICKKVKQSNRQVFNSYVNRTKGSAIEEFWKTHSRTKTPEVLKKKNTRQHHKTKTRNLHEGRLPAGTSQPERPK